VLVAYEMNGEDIPRPYGYPVRCIVPGHAGARNCKFLEMVTVTDEPCKGNSNWKQYAVHAPDVPMIKIANFEEYHEELMLDPAVQEMPVQSLITSPGPGDILSAAQRGDKTIFVKGIAWGGGGSGVNRVDVSLNADAPNPSFTRADVLERPIVQPRRSQWSWVFFEKEIPIPDAVQADIANGKPVDLVLTSKALNAAWNVQPAEPMPNWNSHGCCVNHWYRVPVTLCPVSPKDVTAPEGDFANKPSGGRFATRFVNFESPEDAEARRRDEKAMVAAGDARAGCSCGLKCPQGQGCQRAVFDGSPTRRVAETGASTA